MSQVNCFRLIFT